MMAVDRMNVGPADRTRVNIHEDFQVRFWCRELGITQQELRYVVNAVGPVIDDVKQELARMAAAPAS
jgi:hypothetical protein